MADQDARRRQRELSETARNPESNVPADRRAGDRRATERRQANLGPSAGAGERRTSDRRADERRRRR